MKRVLLVGVMTVALMAPASAQAAYVLVTLGFVFNSYSTQAACMAAGAAMGTSTGTRPNYYCVEVTNSPVSPTGGGTGPF
jgi:opacity protein-like surface antigen